MPDLTNFELQTERLRLTTKVEDYVQETFAEFTEEVTQYLIFRTTGNIQDTIDFTERCLLRLQTGEALHTVVLDKQTGEFLGRVDLGDLKSGHPKFGLWFKQSAQRKGYGFEACMALVNWARENVQFEYLIYDPFVANIASNALAKKMGGKLINTGPVTNIRGDTFQCNVYYIYVS